MRRQLFARLGLLTSAAVIAACASAGVPGDGGPELAAFTPDRAEVALGLGRYDVAVDDQARAAALAHAWRHRGALIDDASLRRLVREAEGVPPSLRAAQQIERIAARASTSQEEALSSLTGLTDMGDDATRWTAARRMLLEASLYPSSGEQQALVLLRRVRRLRPAGAIGAIQSAQAWLMEGSLEHRAERYREAIAAYLKVEPSSGLWRESRLGMAWCQLRISQPERAIAVLALLPGGLTGDPERALVAAMAAGMLGKIEAAQAVIQEARDRSKAWLDGDVDTVAVTEDAMSVTQALRLREEEEGLGPRLRAHPAVRLYAAELNAARQLASSAPDRPELAAYVSRLEAARPALFEPLIERERARVLASLDALDGLEAQLK